MTSFSLTRSKRKTIAIHITRNAAVEVRAPLKASKFEIDRFVASKQDWINKHLADKKRCLQKKAIFSLNYGDIVILQGNEYPITEKEIKSIGFDGKEFQVPPGLNPEEIRQAVIQIYKLAARQTLTNRVIEYARLTGICPASVRINSAKTRWGSCSGKNSINISWRLIMAEDDVIDYVVVHELAHIIEHNHSDRFWSVVSAVLPDYKKRQEKLKELQKRLISENWE